LFYKYRITKRFEDMPETKALVADDGDLLAPPFARAAATWISILRSSSLSSALSPCEAAWNGPESYHFGPAAPHRRLGTQQAWPIVYHGVSEVPSSGNAAGQPCYSTRVTIPSKEHPSVGRHCSAEPVWSPVHPRERRGAVASVVLPTGIGRRDDLGVMDRVSLSCSTAAKRIGVARRAVPDSFPPEIAVKSPEAKK
jgi:hypothetical protein